MENCGLGVLDMTAYTAKNAFDNTGYDISTDIALTRAGKEKLVCVSCKPGYKSDSLYNDGVL